MMENQVALTSPSIFETFTLLLLLYFVLCPLPFVFYSPLWSHLSHIFKLFLSLTFWGVPRFHSLPTFHPTHCPRSSFANCILHQTCKPLFWSLDKRTIYLPTILNQTFPNLVHYFAQVTSSFPVAQLVKNLPAMWETWVRSLVLGRAPGEGNSYPLQYSGLENSMDCIVHRVAKCRTRLRHFQFTSLH